MERLDLLGLLYKQTSLMVRVHCLYNNPKPIGKKRGIAIAIPLEAHFVVASASTTFSKAEMILCRSRRLILEVMLMMSVTVRTVPTVRSISLSTASCRIAMRGEMVTVLILAVKKSAISKPSVPLRATIVVVTLILRHDQPFFLNNLGIIFSLHKCP